MSAHGIANLITWGALVAVLLWAAYRDRQDQQ